MVIEERDRETQKEELYSVTKIKNLSSKKLNLTREIIKKSFATYSKSSTIWKSSNKKCVKPVNSSWIFMKIAIDPKKQKGKKKKNQYSYT